MAVKTFFSNRIYKDTLNNDAVSLINNALHIYNTAKIKTYSLIPVESLLQESLHLTIKNTFNMNDYFTNSAVQEAKGLSNSNAELHNLYIKNIKDTIKHKENKIKSISNKIKYNSIILKHIIDISKATKLNKKLPKLRTFLHIKFIESLDGVTVFNVKKKCSYCLYDYEHIILRPYIKKLKNRLSHLIYGLNISKQRLMNLQTNGVKKSCFGTKDLFLKQYTNYKNNHKEWKNKFHHARNKSLTISGRKDAAQGNFCFRYNTINKELEFRSYNNIKCIIPNVYFPYGQDVVKTILYAKIAVAWNITDHGDYYIIKVMSHIPVDKTSFNYSKGDGVVSYDINVNHIAWANIDSKGNLLNHGIIRYNLKNKTSGQINKIIEKASVELVYLAVKYNKPLVGEKLNTEKSKNTLKYGNKKRNRMISQFAYDKVIQSIVSRAYKWDTEVFYVNAAYTSQIGKIKYMKNKGLSIHESAAYVIGRRCLGFKDKVINSLMKYVEPNKHHWSQWNVISKGLKEVPVHSFYLEYETKGYSDIKNLSKQLISNYYNRIA